MCLSEGHVCSYVYVSTPPDTAARGDSMLTFDSGEPISGQITIKGESVLLSIGFSHGCLTLLFHLP